MSRVVDRDLRSAQEVLDLQASGTRVLSRRHLESYLLDDEVLAKLCEEVGAPERLADVVAERDKAVASSITRGNDPDDIKSAAGEFYVAVRQMLGLTGAGNSTEAFLADTLAPLVRPTMAVYEQLRQDVFG